MVPQNALMRSPFRNCTILPNEVFQLGLHPTAIAVYAYLRRLEDPKTYKCWPSYEKIAQAVGCSRRTVAKYVSELCEKRLITVEQTSVITKDGLKWNGNLCYTVLPIRWAVDHYHEQQLARLDEVNERQRIQSMQRKRDGRHRQQSRAVFLTPNAVDTSGEELPL